MAGGSSWARARTLDCVEEAVGEELVEDKVSGERELSCRVDMEPAPEEADEAGERLAYGASPSVAGSLPSADCVTGC